MSASSLFVRDENHSINQIDADAFHLALHYERIKADTQKTSKQRILLDRMQVVGIRVLGAEAEALGCGSAWLCLPLQISTL